jgi:hypothetical protein
MKEKIKKQETGFTQIKNEVANDERLSWKARGIFLYIFSKPDDWDFSVERISRKSKKDGFKATNAGIKELEDCGYLERKKMPNGRKEWHIRFEPTCQKGKLPKSQPAEMASISNKELNTNKDISSKEEIEQSSELVYEPIEKEVKTSLKKKAKNFFAPTLNEQSSTALIPTTAKGKKFQVDHRNQELQFVEDIFTQAFGSKPAPIWHKDKAGRKFDLNRGACKRLAKLYPEEPERLRKIINGIFKAYTTDKFFPNFRKEVTPLGIEKNWNWYKQYFASKKIQGKQPDNKFQVIVED